MGLNTFGALRKTFKDWMVNMPMPGLEEDWDGDGQGQPPTGSWDSRDGTSPIDQWLKPLPMPGIGPSQGQPLPQPINTTKSEGQPMGIVMGESAGMPDPGRQIRPRVPFPADPPEIAQLESTLAPRKLTTKDKIIAAIETFAPTLVAGLVGGEAAAAGAAGGVNEELGQRRDSRLRKRTETLGRIKEARNNQMQRYETDVRADQAAATREMTEAWHRQQSADKRYTTDANTMTKLRKMGLDAEGNAIPREQLSELERNQLDLRDAQSEYAQARADALTNPNNPQFQLKMREAEARMMALRQTLEFRRRADERAASALDLQQRTFEVNTRGTDRGVPLPGVKITEDGSTVGARFQSNVGPTSSTRTMAQQGQATASHFPDLRRDIADLDAKGKLGPLIGRYEDFMSGKVGAGDPDYARFRANMGLMETALVRTHMGAKGGIQMMDHFKGLINSHGMDAATLGASLDGIERWIQTYGGQDTQVVGGQPGIAMPAPGTVAPPAGQPGPTDTKLRKSGGASVRPQAPGGGQPAPEGTVVPVRGGGYKVKTAAGTWVRSDANGKPIQ